MTRFEDWPTRLSATIEAARGRAFDWKDHNCGTFVCDCIAAMTGERLHERIAELHTTAARATVSSQFLIGHVTEILDMPIGAGLTRRGDVVLVWTGEVEDDNRVLAICDGAHAVGVGPDGLAFVSMRRAVCGWRV